MRWFAALVALVATAFPVAWTRAGEGETMSTPEEIAHTALTLEPGRFFAFDESDDVAITARLREHHFDGVAIAAPASIDLRAQATLPVVVARSLSGLREWDVEFDWNAALVGVRLDTGAIHAGAARAWPPSKRPPSEPEPKGPAPDETNATARSRGAERLDARRSLEIPWEPGPVALTLFYWDWASNTVTTELHSPDTAKPTPPPAPPTAVRAGLLGFGRRPESPVAPEPGLVIEASPIEEERGGVAIHGSFRMPARASQVVDLAAVRDRAAYGDPPAAAIVEVGLVVMGRDRREPLLIPLRVPIAPGSTVAAGEPIEGFFALELRSDDLASLRDATEYCLYAVADRFVSAPTRWTPAAR
jgi:hypothetical protein